MSNTTKKVQSLVIEMNETTKELLQSFLLDETAEKASFELSNKVKDIMLISQEKHNKNTIDCKNILQYLLIKQVMFLINADKNKAFIIESDFKKLQYKFSVRTENFTNGQIRYYNQNYDLDIPENSKEIQQRDERAEELLQELYGLTGK